MTWPRHLSRELIHMKRLGYPQCLSIGEPATVLVLVPAQT